MTLRRARSLSSVFLSTAVLPALAAIAATACDKNDANSNSPGAAPSSMSPGEEKVGKIVDGGAQDAYPPPQAVPPVDAAETAGPMRVVDRYTTHDGELTVTPIHHATLLLQHGGKNIYIDPVHEGTSYVGMPKADYIFITHTHPDHLDPQGIADVKKDGTVLVGPTAVNAKQSMTLVLDNGAKHDFGSFLVEAVPMYNSKRGPDAGALYHEKGAGDGYIFTFGTGKSADGGWVPSTGGTIDGGPFISRVYISGDTECTPEMRALKSVDIAFVCMNLPYTMPPDEAATCVNAFKPRIVYPYHYRGSNLDQFTQGIAHGNGVEVKVRDWYAK